MDLRKANYNTPLQNLREDANKWLYIPYHVEFRVIEMPIIPSLQSAEGSTGLKHQTPYVSIFMSLLPFSHRANLPSH